MTRSISNSPPETHVAVFGLLAERHHLLVGNAERWTPASTPTCSYTVLSFVLVGDPMNPNGGLCARFARSEPSESGSDVLRRDPDNPSRPRSTRSNTTASPTSRSTRSICCPTSTPLRASYYVHPLSRSHARDRLVRLSRLPTPGPTQTTYYMIPTQNLPLLEPLRAIPVVGNPLADLLQPDLRYLVNWGYGNPAYGYSTGPANVPTPFGLFPPLSATTVLPGDLAIGTQQGIGAFASDLRAGGFAPLSGLSLSSLAQTPTTMPSATPQPSAARGRPRSTALITALRGANTNITNAVHQCGRDGLRDCCFRRQIS